MTANRPRTDESTRTNGGVGSVARRRVLQTIGAGAGLTALSGLGSARSISVASVLSSPVGAVDAEYAQQASGDSIHPVYGFAAPSPEVEPPVEPDHEVRALIAEREGVPIPEFFFEPTGLAIEPGDTVQFTMTTPHHNVVAYHPGFGFAQRVPDGVPPFSGPLLPAGGYWLYTFEEEGVYEMNCAPHEYFGMVMRIVVGSASGPAAQPLPDLCAPPEGSGSGGEGSESDGESGDGGGGDGGGGDGDDGGGGGPPLRHPEFTAYTVLTDPALAPDAILGAGSVSWNDLAAESKQVFLQPVGFPPCGNSGNDGGSSGGGGESSDADTGGSSEDNNGKAKQGGNGKAKQSG